MCSQRLIDIKRIHDCWGITGLHSQTCRINVQFNTKPFPLRSSRRHFALTWRHILRCLVSLSRLLWKLQRDLMSAPKYKIIPQKLKYAYLSVGARFVYLYWWINDCVMWKKPFKTTQWFTVKSQLCNSLNIKYEYAFFWNIKNYKQVKLSIWLKEITFKCVKNVQ